VELAIPATPANITFANESPTIADRKKQDAMNARSAASSPPAEDDEAEDKLDDQDDAKSRYASSLSFTEKQVLEKATAREREVAAAQTALDERFTQDQQQCQEAGLYQVHAKDAPMVLLNVTRLRDKDEYRIIFDALKSKGAFRRLASIDAQQFDAAFDGLLQTHPLFREVIAFVRKSLLLRLQRGMPQCFPALLLTGPPGLGKTHFAKALAKVMGAACHALACDTSIKSSALLGLDKGWGNSTAGIVYDAVVGGDCANPVIVLDEIDKCNDPGGYQHPLASLHTLLEPVSAAGVTDISLDLQFDASLVSWISTCNDEARVPETLRSRMKVFRIAPPTDAAVAIAMARVMLTATHTQIGLDGFAEPDQKIATLIAHLAAREQRQVLEDAYADAIAGGRHALRLEDFAHLDGERKQAPPTNFLH
jgi:ATP-dependent Lon protease